MASIGYGTCSPSRSRNKLRNAKKFLSLQVSHTGQAISKEIDTMLHAQILSRKRKKVINEIFTTEKTYQQQLHTLNTVFVEELRKAKIVSANVLTTIFSNIEAIEGINKELLNHLETLGVGDAFLAMAPFIKLYSTYANNFERASNMLLECEKKSPEFVSFITRQEAKEECNGLNLRALLITPVQRVPRYKLLLESLLNKTPREYPDFSKLEEATEEIAKVAEHINENIRQRENFQKMLSIQKSLTGEGAPKILAPGRFFIKEGPLLKACRRGSQERMFFLFSDILIYAKKSGTVDNQSTYSCRRVFPLSDCELEQMLGSSLNTDGAADAGSLFKISCREKSILLYSKSKLVASSWFNATKDAIGKLKLRRASLKRVSLDKRDLTPLRRSAVIKNKILSTPNEIRKKTAEIDCLSPFIKDSLYPLRKELKNTTSTKTSNTLKRYDKSLPQLISRPTSHTALNEIGDATSGDATSGDEDAETDISDVSHDVDESVESARELSSYESYASTSQGDESDYDDGEPRTPSGLIDSAGQAMTDSAGSSDFSDESSTEEEQESDDEMYKGVTTRAQKRRITINEKENQFFIMSPEPPKKTCFLPKLLCGGVNRSPLSSLNRK